MKGTYSSEQEALKKSSELGCKGTHKNQEKWLPCKNEKELKELEEFAEENGYNDELKDIYLREVFDRNKEYEWDQIFDQTFD